MNILLLALAQVTGNPQPEAETLTALTTLGGNYALMARDLTTAAPPGPRRGSPFIKPESLETIRFWMDRTLRPALRTGFTPLWRGIRYDDFDVVRFDNSLSSGETYRYVDLIGVAGLHWRTAVPETISTKETARTKLLALINTTLLHPTPNEPNMRDYLRSVDLPSGRKLWYGYVKIGVVLDVDRRVLSPRDWHRSFLTFTDGRTSYLQWVQTDSSLPRPTSGAKTPGGDGGKRILRF